MARPYGQDPCTTLDEEEPAAMINPLFNSYVRRIATRAVALILASLAVGAFFNAASPLGFPLVKPAPKPPANEGTAAERDGIVKPDANKGDAPAQPAPAPKAPVQSSGVYSNEPLAVQVMPGAPVQAEPPAAPAPGSPYGNETLGARVVRAPSNPEPVAPPAPQPGANAPASKSGKNIYNGGTVAAQVVPVKPAAEAPPRVADEPVAVTWAEAKTMLQTGEAVLVDARPLTAFQAGSIPGAISLPANRIKEEMPAFMKRVDTNRWLIVYCGDQGSASSEDVGKTLIREYGYRHVFHMPGGYAEWQIAETGRKTEEKKQ